MTILEIYEKYKIMPQLAEHQLKVAGVASTIIDNLSLIIGKKEIIAACLLHDMGNIIKFDFSKTKLMLNENLDLVYWQTIKDEYVKKYGADEHIATVEIAKELSVSSRVVGLIDSVGFNHAEDTLNSGDLGKQICAYCDMRVMPKGIASLEQRFADLRVRYAHRANEWGEVDKRDIFEKSLREIEKQIFEHCAIQPGDITEETVEKVVVELKSFRLPVK